MKSKRRPFKMPRMPLSNISRLVLPKWYVVSSTVLGTLWAHIAWDWQAMQLPGQCASSGSIGKSPSGQWCRLTLFLLHLIPTDKICDPDNCQIVSILPPKNLAALKTRGNFIKTLFLASIWPSGSKSVVSFRQKTRVPEIINWMSLIVYIYF